MNRRNFSKLAAISGIVGLAPSQIFSSVKSSPDLKISLAQWSLNKAIKAGELSGLDFAKKSRSFGIEGIEYVSGLSLIHI